MLGSFRFPVRYLNATKMDITSTANQVAAAISKTILSFQDLFQKLPEPDADWPAKDRLKWLQTAANIFDLVYKGEGGIVVSLARAERSPRQ